MCAISAFSFNITWEQKPDIYCSIAPAGFFLPRFGLFLGQCTANLAAILHLRRPTLHYCILLPFLCYPGSRVYSTVHWTDASGDILLTCSESSRRRTAMISDWNVLDSIYFRTLACRILIIVGYRCIRPATCHIFRLLLEKRPNITIDRKN